MYIGAALVSMLFTGAATAQDVASPKREYPMTDEAGLELPQVINDSLYIHNCIPGGWVRGLGIRGSFIGSRADWLRIMTSGVARLVVRAKSKTDEGELISIT